MVLLVFNSMISILQEQSKSKNIGLSKNRNLVSAKRKKYTQSKSKKENMTDSVFSKKHALSKSLGNQMYNVKNMLVSDSKGGNEIGKGTPESPHKQIIRQKMNQSACFYCPSIYCECELMHDLLDNTFESLKMRRITSVAGKIHMCAKSIEPNFVSRLIRCLNITKDDVFYDLGSGNGSVLFQVAFITGARCIGVELCPHNSELSRQAWSVLEPKLARIKSKPMPEITIITGNLVDVISKPEFGATGNVVIWSSNLLMPKSITAYMAERFRTLASGCRIGCLDDLYPHTREVAKTMDPEAFELFIMKDYQWSSGAVEWTSNVGPFYIHKRK